MESFEWVDVIVRFINGVGFPIFVCVWQMVVAHKDSKALEAAITKVGAQGDQTAKTLESLSDVLYNMVLVERRMQDVATAKEKEQETA